MRSIKYDLIKYLANLPYFKTVQQKILLTRGYHITITYRFVVHPNLIAIHCFLINRYSITEKFFLKLINRNTFQ